jgi:hypothetical protein
MRILLREKGGTVRWQPVSPTLMAHLQQHALDRHAPPPGQLLRYRTGKPITSRRSARIVPLPHGYEADAVRGVNGSHCGGLTAVLSPLATSTAPCAWGR